MSRPPRRDEFLAERVVEFALGCPVRHLDDGLVPGQVDAEINLEPRTVGALEITQMGDQKQFQLIEALKRDGWRWDTPGQWVWTLVVGRLAELNRLRRIVPPIIQACETNGVTRPLDLPARLLQLDADARWIAWECESSLQGLPQVGAAPRIMLSPRGIGGVLPSGWAGLDTVVADLLATDNAASHIAKLRSRSDAAERHLFLIVTDRAVEAGWYFKLQRPDSVPNVDVTLPTGLDALWLGVSTEWSLQFHRQTGWARYQTPEEIVQLAAV